MATLNDQAKALAAAFEALRAGEAGAKAAWDAARLDFAAWAGARFLGDEIPPKLQEPAAKLLGELGQLGGLPLLVESDAPEAAEDLAEILVQISALDLVRRGWLAAGKALDAGTEADSEAFLSQEAWSVLSMVSPVGLVVGLASGKVTGDDLAEHSAKVAATIGEGVKAIATGLGSWLLPGILLGGAVVGGVLYFRNRGRRR